MGNSIRNLTASATGPAMRPGFQVSLQISVDGQKTWQTLSYIIPDDLNLLTINQEYVSDLICTLVMSLAKIKGDLPHGIIGALHAYTSGA